MKKETASVAKPPPSISAEDKGHSPLAGLGGAEAIELAEAPFVGKLIIRGNAADEKFRDAVGEIIGAHPPTKANTAAAAGEFLILWLGPDEWQIHCPPQQTAEIAAKLRAKWQDTHSAAVEVSDYYLQITIGGDAARAALQSGCPLDLHPRKFCAGACAQTRFHNAAIVLRQTADTPPAYNIQVRRSFAVYVWKHLCEAAREFQEN
jgi:sarcosine oxidase subunit gamma